MKNIFLFLIIFLYACSEDASEKQTKAISDSLKKEKSVSVVVYKHCLQSRTLYYYSIDSCEYVGELSFTSSDFIAHSGQCSFCRKKQIVLMDSLIKANLKEFLPKR